MEISVGFADKDKRFYIENGYEIFDSEIGKVYIPLERVEASNEIYIRYEKHPWIETFEVDGVRPKPIKRTGFGNKDVRGFVKSLSTIYANAYNEYENASDSTDYFVKVTENFVRSFTTENETKMFKKFCGFVENMWREGNEEMHDVAMNNMLPILSMNEDAWDFFYNAITSEFKEYIKANRY